MNKWSDIQDLKKKKALLDEKWDKAKVSIECTDGGNDLIMTVNAVYINQPERKEDGDEKRFKGGNQAIRK